MMIDSIQPIAAAQAEMATPAAQAESASPAAQPGSATPAARASAAELTDFVSHINETPGTAIESVEKMIAGEPTEIHSLMIELEVAKLQMQLAVEVRDKLVEAYQELSRMQV